MMIPQPVITDEHGDRYAAVHVAELDEWAWLLARIEDWLLHAHHETIADWAEFSGPCGPRIHDITDMLGHWSVRMRNLAQGRP